MTGPDLLRKQLELVRFEKAIDYIDHNARGQKHMNANELAYINSILLHSQGDPWREEETHVKLPSGHLKEIAIISNPHFTARDIISQASTMAGNGDLAEAATYLYSQLVLHHFFKEANRRTAVAATYWLLTEKGVDIKPMGLLEIGLGDLRASDQLDALRSLIRATIHLAKKK